LTDFGQLWQSGSATPIAAMKTKISTKNHKAQRSTNQDVSDLLAEAMKQPGVKTVMDVFESAEKYRQRSDEFANYIDWQRFPPSFSSCETTLA
jgi:hypothetical protein